MHNLQIGIVVFDLKANRIEFQNQAAVDILSPQIKPRDYHAISTLLKTQSDEQGPGLSESSGEAKVVRLDDRFIGFSAYRIHEADYLWVFISDITEKKRYESIAGAVNTMENTGYIFSGIRHEVGNPINSIKMTLSMLKEQLYNFRLATVEEYLGRCLDELARVEFLLRSLKNINLYEEPVIENIEISFFIHNFLKLIATDFSRKGIEIQVEADTESPLWMSVDPRPLQQVLLNLFTNAADALRQTPDPRITLSVYKKNNLVWIKVSDNGEGIPPEYLEKIFKPFFTTKKEGNGLGLVLSKKMLAAMNCTLEVESDEELGVTTFIISIPEGHNERASLQQEHSGY